jgi:hypothetical protein
MPVACGGMDQPGHHLVSLPARWYNFARSATLAQWQSNRFVSDRLSVQVRWVAHSTAPFAGLFCETSIETGFLSIRA